MLSHGNIVANVACLRGDPAWRGSDDRFLSMLPLSHMFERTGGYYLPLSLGAEVVFARGDHAARRGSRHAGADRGVRGAADLRALQGAHRRRRLPGRRSRRALFDAVRRARLSRRAGTRVAARSPAACRALRALVAAPILARLGGRLRLAVVGGAALDPALSRTFIGLGLTMLQGYGMTEASPVISVNRVDDNVPDSVGAPLPGVEVRLLSDAASSWCAART